MCILVKGGGMCETGNGWQLEDRSTANTAIGHMCSRDGSVQCSGSKSRAVIRVGIMDRGVSMDVCMDGTNV